MRHKDPEESIKAVDTFLDNKGYVQTYWKAASGFSHGRQWPNLTILLRTQIEPMSNATATVTLMRHVVATVRKFEQLM